MPVAELKFGGEGSLNLPPHHNKDWLLKFAPLALILVWCRGLFEKIPSLRG